MQLDLSSSFAAAWCCAFCSGLANPQHCVSSPACDLQAAAAGPQTDTAHFASWEGSTRGIGSKLMAGMGYVQGQGLGTTRPGTVAPLEVAFKIANALLL